MDISGWVTHWASWTPTKTALRFEGVTLSYSEFERRVAHLAGFLVEAGVEPGARVAYLGPNSPQLLELFFACARIGSIFVPLNARMPARELGTFVAHSEPSLLVAEQGFRETALESAPGLAPGGIVTFTPEEGGSLTASAPRLDPNRDLDPSAPVLIAYTSGTSGVPKGALLTHGALTANALNAVTAFAMTADDEVLAAAPMFHVGGLNITTTPAIFAGATVVVHRRFDPGLALEEIERGVTLLVAVPAMSFAMIAHPRWTAANVGSLRCLITGSTVVPEKAMRPWFDRGIPVAQVYGSTETCPIATVVPPAEAAHKALTAGKPVMFCQARVVDAGGRDLPSGEVGEVWLRGDNVMRGYWRNPQATGEAMHEGWFRTGDAGFVDDDGYLHIVDRMKDIIIVGGSNVYPADLETILAESTDILEAAVVARPDEKLGEVPVAFVVPATAGSQTAEDVLALFNDRIADYKRPRDVVFVESLPRTALGKVQKQVLRAFIRERAHGTPLFSL